MSRLRLLPFIVVLLLLVPAPAEAGRTKTIDIDAPHYVEAEPALQATVYLPDGYDESRRYPVLYLLHGFGESHETWAVAERGRALAIATAARFDGIIVMPDQRDGFSTDFHNFGAYGRPAWTRHFTESLIPQIEKDFPIRPGRRWHAIAGASMGGFGALTIAGQLPSYFGSVAIFSAPTDIRRPESPLFVPAGGTYVSAFGPPGEAYAAGHNPVEMVENLRHTRVFARVGDGIPEGVHIAPDKWIVDRVVLGAVGPAIEAWVRIRNDEYAAAARAAGVDIDYAVRTGSHDWPYLSRMLEEALAWNPFGEVKSRPSSWTFSTVRRTGRAWQFAYEFSAPPAAVARFRYAGGVISGEGVGTVTMSAPGCTFTAVLPFTREC